MPSGHIRKRTTKKGTVYQIIIELPTDESTGKRQRIYETVDGTKKQAERRMRELISDMDNSTYIKPTNMTLSSYIDKWFELYLKDKSPTTLNGYRKQIDTYIKPMLGAIPLQSLTTSVIQQWVNDISAHSPITGKPLSAKTVKNIFLNLSAALERAVVLEYIKKNPCKNVELPKPKKYEAKIYDEDGINKIIACSKGTDMELPIMLELNLGLRRGELLALRWEHIDFERKTVKICENRVCVDNNEVITKSPKSQSGNRIISISDSLIEMLQRHKEDCQEKFGITHGRDYIVCKADGSPYNPNYYTKKFKKFLRKNNLDEIRLHDMRHTNASFMLRQGISPKVAQQRLGHSDFSTTMNIYSHVMQSVEQEAAQKLDKALFE